MSFRGGRTSFALSFALLLASSSAHAGDPAAAQGLFNDAKKLMAEDHWAEACPKLEESQRLDPGIGTLFNLANCHEHIGRTATAWAEFLEVATSAKAHAQAAREKAARDRAALLEPKLTRMTITIKAEAPGLTVLRDGEAVGRAQWGSAVPVDPGQHVFVVSAPGKRRWEKSLRIAPDTSNVELAVPPLADEPPPVVAAAEPTPVAPPPPAPIIVEPVKDSSEGRAQRITGLVVAGVGLVSVGIGGAFGLTSKAKHDDSASHCDGNNHCDAVGVALRDDAIHAGTISTIGFGVGAAALVTGTVLFFTAPSGNTKSARIQASPLIGQNGSGFSVRGAW